MIFAYSAPLKPTYLPPRTVARVISVVQCKTLPHTQHLLAVVTLPYYFADSKTHTVVSHLSNKFTTPLDVHVTDTDS